MNKNLFQLKHAYVGEKKNVYEDGPFTHKNLFEFSFQC